MPDADVGTIRVRGRQLQDCRIEHPPAECSRGRQLVSTSASRISDLASPISHLLLPSTRFYCHRLEKTKVAIHILLPIHESEGRRWRIELRSRYARPFVMRMARPPGARETTSASPKASPCIIPGGRRSYRWGLTGDTRIPPTRMAGSNRSRLSVSIEAYPVAQSYSATRARPSYQG